MVLLFGDGSCVVCDDGSYALSDLVFYAVQFYAVQFLCCSS